MNRDLPIAKRLDAIASQLGAKASEWIKPAPIRSDVGKRPTLDSLGPVHWHAPDAPAWSGTGLDGKPVSSFKPRNQLTDWIPEINLSASVD